MRGETLTEWSDADQNDAGTENTSVIAIFGEDAVSRDFEKDRIELVIGRVLCGISGLYFSSDHKSSISLSGTILLSQIVRTLW
jgi:hypothetical protein